VFYLAQERKLAAASLNVAIYGLRSFYGLVLQRALAQLHLCLPGVKRAVRRPIGANLMIVLFR